MIGLTALKNGVKKSDEDAVKKGDMEQWHPAQPGSPAGSQAGEKKNMKTSPYSPVSPFTK
jgi:hypothetical protein